MNQPPTGLWLRSTLDDDADLTGLESLAGMDLTDLIEHCFYIEAITEVLIGDPDCPTRGAMLSAHIPPDVQSRLRAEADVQPRGITRWMLIEVAGLPMFVCHVVVLGADGHDFKLIGVAVTESRDLMVGADTLLIVPAEQLDAGRDSLLAVPNDLEFWATTPTDLPSCADLPLYEAGTDDDR
jgi:hypothetical protein